MKRYLAALDAVPRLSRQAIGTGMAFFMKLGDTLSKLGYSNIQLARSLAERRRAEQQERHRIADILYEHFQ